MKIIGIDPGFKGGISVFENDKLKEVIVMPIKEENDKRKIDATKISEFFLKHRPEKAIIEQVHAMPGQGVVSMFSFGENYGKVLGVLEALFIPYEIVSPMKWKKQVLGENYSHSEKHGAYDFCHDNFPDINFYATKRSKVPHDGMTDSVCIGYYLLKNQKVDTK
jgi:crossover junction endodeoxyribonuclease RuvC